MKALLDSNILLDYPEILDNKEYEYIIHSIVCEEIDNIIHNSLDQDKKYKARKARNAIKNNKKIEYSLHIPSYSLPLGWDLNKYDNDLLRICKDLDCLLITNDLAMQIKANSIGIKYIEWHSNNNELYTGIKYIEIQDSDNCIEDIINNIDLSELVENQYVLIGLWEYNKEFEQNQFKLEKGYRYSKGIFENIRNPRLGEKLNNCFKDNVEQRLVYDALNNDDIDILVVYGDAGVGKNYSVLANTFSLVKQPTKNKKNTYKSKSILYTRNVVEVGERLGYLPGNYGEKFCPYTAPARQNLQKIIDTACESQDDVETLIKDKYYIEQPLAFIRGTTFDNTYLIFDECANASIDDLKTFITRAGDFSKVILLGSFNQIDKRGNTEINNGLYEIIQKYKGQKNFACIKLNNQERSYLSRQADKLLK